MPRRKKGELIGLEIEIMQTAMSMSSAQGATFHGFGLARVMGEGGSGRLVAHGTLYKALSRLEDMGLLTSAWEQDPPADRPRRRLYEITAEGARAVHASSSDSAQHSTTPRLAPGPA